MAFDQSIALCIGFKMIFSLRQIDASLLGEDRCHTLSKFLVRVDSRPHRGAPCWKLVDSTDGL